MIAPILAALFAVWGAATLWGMRRALAAREPSERLREARRLLLLVSAGAPLLAALILAAM